MGPCSLSLGVLQAGHHHPSVWTLSSFSNAPPGAPVGGISLPPISVPNTFTTATTHSYDECGTCK